MSTPDTPTYDELASLVVRLQKVLAEQAEALKRANARIADLEAETLRLKNGGPDGKPVPNARPDWVKLNKPEVFGPPAPRKRRPQGFTHHRLTPTKEVILTCQKCPDCGRGLSGGSERSRRQVIDLPPMTPTVTDVIVHARYCGVCHKSVVPTVDLSEVVVGQQTFGLGVVSLVAYLDSYGRLPVRRIASLLSCLLQLSVRCGQIVSRLHTVAKQGEATYSDLKQSLRESDFVHADETGWRENGKNGYVWSFSTPLLRYFVYDKSRAHTVPKSVLGETFGGIIRERLLRRVQLPFRFAPTLLGASVARCARADFGASLGGGADLGGEATGFVRRGQGFSERGCQGAGTGASALAAGDDSSGGAVCERLPASECVVQASASVRVRVVHLRGASAGSLGE